MAFFTRVNLNVPVLPPDDSAQDDSPAPSHDHRRYASEPSRPSSNSNSNSSSRGNGVQQPAANHTPTAAAAATSVRKTADRNSKILRDSQDTGSATGATVVVVDGTANSNSVLVTAAAAAGTAAEDEDGEPKRYEYVVDRVLGVEV